jgi:hypothetical protein
VAEPSSTCCRTDCGDSLVPMSDYCSMRIPGWALLLWPGKKTFGVAVPSDEPIPPDGRHRFTEQHAQLLSQLESEADAGWSRTALIACLEQLRTSNITEAGQVAVLDAWVDGADAFCVVYQAPYEHREVGIRRSLDDASSSHKYRPGAMTNGYDMGNAKIPDPIAFGSNVADFDIGEPGTGPLRYDEGSGTSWWGSFGDALPLKPPGH